MDLSVGLLNKLNVAYMYAYASLRAVVLFLRDAFQSQKTKAKKARNKERTTQRHDNAQRPSFQSYHRPTLAHHSRFSLQSVASVESCCRTLLRSGAFLEGPRLRNFLCADGFRKIRIPSHHTCLRYLKDAFLFHYSTVPHCSTVPLTSG